MWGLSMSVFWRLFRFCHAWSMVRSQLKPSPKASCLRALPHSRIPDTRHRCRCAPAGSGSKKRKRSKGPCPPRRPSWPGAAGRSAQTPAPWPMPPSLPACFVPGAVFAVAFTFFTSSLIRTARRLLRTSSRPSASRDIRVIVSQET